MIVPKYPLQRIIVVYCTNRTLHMKPHPSRCSLVWTRY